MNARSAPARVGETHVPDEIPNFRRYRRATFATPTLPSPIEAKSLAMPGDNRLRFDKEQRRSPIVPQPREPRSEERRVGKEWRGRLWSWQCDEIVVDAGIERRIHDAVQPIL